MISKPFVQRMAILAFKKMSSQEEEDLPNGVNYRDLLQIGSSLDSGKCGKSSGMCLC
jgi:hypothetical protein